MTDALAQNTENITSTADILLNLKGGNLASRKTEADDSFSNLISTLDANTKKVQTDFVKKAAKTNTSSINKLAIKNGAQGEKIAKNLNETTSGLNKTNSSDKNISTVSDDDKNIDFDVEAEKSSEDEIKNIEVNTSENNEKITVKEDFTNIKQQQEELSDINNSSHVESSPVFSNTEETEDIQLDEQDTEDIKDILANVLISFGVDVAQNKDLKSEIDESLLKVETLDEVPNAIDEIFSSLDNLDLSKENKNNLFQTFEQIKDVINNSLKNYNNDDEILLQAKEFLNSIAPKDDLSVNENDLSEIKLSEDINLKDELINNDLTEKTYDKDDTKEVLEDIKNTIKEVKDAIEKNDFKNLDTLLNNLDDLTKNIENSNTDVVRDLSKEIQNLKNEITKVLKLSDSDDFKLNSDKVVQLSSDIENILNKTDKLSDTIPDEKFLEVESSNEADEIYQKQEKNELMSEILKAFEDFKNTSDYEKLSDENKKKIDDFINKISNLQTENVEITKSETEQDKKITEEIISKVKDFVNNIQNNVQSDDIQPLLKEDTLNNSNSSKNTIDLTDVFKKVNDSFESDTYLSQNNNNNDSASYDRSYNETSQIIEADFSNDELNVTQENIQESEVNIQKQTFIDTFQDDMLLDISVQNSDESGALSVADEVAKMALNQQNSSLNTLTTVHGAITYDNMAPEMSMIKNAAQLMKASNTSQAQSDIGGDIFNQITNKITQLQQEQGQKLTMVLRPHNLGRLSIELTSNHLGLTTNILAQNDDVRAYIERNIDSLRQQLSDAGVNVNNIQIKTMGQEGSTNYQGNSQNFDFNEQNQQNQNANGQNNPKQNYQNQKQNQEFLADMTNYDMHFAKDFSSVLNKTISYNLN